MGWFSLATRLVPQLFRGAAKATSTLWKGGSTVIGSTAKVASAAAKNPKTALALGIGSYAGWSKLNNPDESYGTAVGKTARAAVGEAGSFGHDAVNGFTGEKTVENVTDSATNVISDVKETASEAKSIVGTLGDTLKGISNFFGNLFGGNGTNMFTNFFNNIGQGNISGLGIGALIAAGYLIFGRTGLLGKIGGMLMAMMMIGNNSQSQTQNLAQAQTQQKENEQVQEQQRGMHR